MKQYPVFRGTHKVHIAVSDGCWQRGCYIKGDMNTDTCIYVFGVSSFACKIEKIRVTVCRTLVHFILAANLISIYQSVFWTYLLLGCAIRQGYQM